MELDEDAVFEQIQVVTTIEQGTNEELLALSIVGEHPESTLMVGSGQKTGSIPSNELSLFGENISLLKRMFPVTHEQGENNRLDNLFKCGIFGNPEVEDTYIITSECLQIIPPFTQPVREKSDYMTLHGKMCARCSNLVCHFKCIF